MGFHRVACFLLACSLLSVGCLSQSYEISVNELRRTTQLPDLESGADLQVKQQSSWSSDIERSEREAYRGRRSSAGVWIPWHGHHHWHHAHGSRRAGRRVSRGVSSSSASSNGDAIAVKAAAAVVIAATVAVTAVVTISATEGARFDGTMRVPKDQPVLLVHQDGTRSWQALQTLASSDLDGIAYGAVAGFEKDTWLGRRNPLSRQGWVYQTELGAASLKGVRGRRWNAFSGRLALGYMPTNNWGLLLGGAFTSGQNPLAAAGESSSAVSDEQVVEVQTYLQADWWPLQWSRLHIGPYATVGQAWALSNYEQRDLVESGLFAGAGAALQLDWTTSLAVTLRLGSSLLPSFDREATALGLDGYRLATGATLGLSIY